MGLAMYSAPNEDAKFTSTNPFRVTLDGRVGGAIDQLVYLRNDDSTLWFSNITVQAVDNGGLGRTGGTTPHCSWKLIEKSVEPVNAEWESVAEGNAITLSTDIGTSSLANITAYIPIWVRVEIPRNQPAATITDIVFQINYTENLI